jgi:hypothetical protein
MKDSERTFISAKILWGTKDYIFSHGTEHTQSLLLKAVFQSDFKPWTYILKISEFQIQQENLTHAHTHTHTKCWYTVRYLVSKFLNCHLLNYNFEQNRSHWTPGHLGALHQFPQSKWEFFSQGFLCIPKQWINSMSWNSGYYKNFYKEQRNQFTGTLWVLHTLSCIHTHTHTHTHTQLS